MVFDGHCRDPPGRVGLFFIKIMFFLDRLNRALRPDHPYDTPLLSYNMRAGHKFLSEYDTDFSRATADGNLSRDFDLEATLRRVKCPMLLMRAEAYSHEAWSLVGAIDDQYLDSMFLLFTV